MPEAGHTMRQGDEGAAGQTPGLRDFILGLMSVAWMHALENGGVRVRWGRMTVAVGGEDDRRA